MYGSKIELNLYLQDISRVLRETVYGEEFHNRYLDVMERTIFGMIRMQRELQVPDGRIQIFLSHFLRIPRERAAQYMAHFDCLHGAETV